jgi:hypothetical protein
LGEAYGGICFRGEVELGIYFVGEACFGMKLEELGSPRKVLTQWGGGGGGICEEIWYILEAAWEVE